MSTHIHVDDGHALHLCSVMYIIRGQGMRELTSKLMSEGCVHPHRKRGRALEVLSPYRERHVLSFGEFARRWEECRRNPLCCFDLELEKRCVQKHSFLTLEAAKQEATTEGRLARTRTGLVNN